MKYEPVIDMGVSFSGNCAEFVKSRHSGLSGILLSQCVTKAADSGQAGMTILRYYMTFCEFILLK